MTDNLVIAKKDRAVIRATVDKCIQQISEILIMEAPDLFELEEKLEQLNEASLELKNIDSDIKKLVKEAQLDAELQTAEEYREKIVSCRFKANRKIKELNKVSENSTQLVKEDSDAAKDTISVKLPKLEIIKFSGKHSDWLTFWSSFEKAIHENKNLDPVDKFNYLKTYLTGNALKSIQGFSATSSNYFKCIDLLIERYGKKDDLIQTHLNNIIAIQPVKYSNDIFSLRELYDKIQIQIRSLESLEVNISSYESLLSPIILKLIPSELLLDFHKQYINKNYSSSDILNFLYIQITAREKLQFSNVSHKYTSKYDRIEREKHNFSSAERDPLVIFSSPERKRQSSAHELFVDSKSVKQYKRKCSFCLDFSHESKLCPEVINLPFNEKLTILRKRGVCYRCLQTSSHIGKHCPSKITCEKCRGPHASIMCNREGVVWREENKNRNRQPKRGEENDMASGDNSNKTLSNNSRRTSTYLQTLIAQIRGKNSSALIRVIVDTGSENSYLSKYVANRLNLKKIKSEKIKHGLFGGIEFSENHSRYQFNLCSLDKSFSCRIQALDQDRICTGIDCVSDKKLISALESNNVFLSDVYENRELCLYQNTPEEIHLLLGADMAGQIFTQNIKHLPNLGLSAFGTKLGWVIMGQAKGSIVNARNNDSLSTLSLSLHVSNSSLENLWRLDALGISNEENKTKSDLQEETQKYFLETVKRDSSGRFEISLPWVVEPSVLASNRSMAESALYRTEKKLIASNTKEEYSDIFKSWESDKIIEEVKDDKKDMVYFLPHRPVIKDSSETTKIRPVFNASAHEKNSPSLNDCLTKGPNLIEIIPRILNRFRKYRIGISSDIEKAFLQIKIAEKDRDFLRFFWFDNEGNIKVHRHCRVVFGLTSSPYLLVATLKHLLSQVPQHFVETAQILENSFYIDNSLTSLNSEQEIDKFKNESISILASGHFNLRCWRSNVPTVMSEEAENAPKKAPVLGLTWDLKGDSLTCKVDDKIKIERPYTKRKILSIVQKIFDPIGFTTPVILTPKLILQQTWVLKLKWDDELPENLSRQFDNWVKGIDLLQQTEIPRWLNVDIENENRATLHVFSDASKDAYATCAFLRVETPEGVEIQLVNARSRVSPLKELTIPRLELLSCLIGARIAKTISTDLGLEKIKTTFWTDSTTALGWIRREQSWGTYVHNRVAEIRKLSQVSDWRHVPGTLNPADLPSRGCSFEKLKGSKWWEGPSWLHLPENSWPQAEELPNEELINKEKRKSVLTLLDRNSDENWYYKYFSSYTKIIRMIGWINRFIGNLRNKEKNLSTDLSVQEFEKAEKILFKLIQHDSFTGKTDPKLKSLDPLEDDNGILRVKTRLINRNDTENFRYPIVLPSQHPVVERLILEFHVKNLHAGVGVLMSLLRENFWILKSRKTIRNVVRRCIRCKRFESKRIDAEPGVPPEDRVRDAAIFEIVGTDVAGPLYLSDGTKAWIVLYTCAVYRALHLELISSLSTQCFLQSLRRFIARRGRPYIIYSDNGTNYLGTANALSTLDWNRISTETSSQKIRWKFSPPAAPWWGGWWERLVRIVKEILRKSLGRASLDYEELNTLLCDCEHIVNSRPITYVSEDNKDLNPLTPSIFLQELPSSGVPDLDELDTNTLSRRARYRQKLRDNLRDRFRKEYLGQLRLHSQNKENFQKLNIGDIVLLDDSTRKRIHWPMAKVVELFPGKDGVARLAKVQTQSGTFLRPIQRLFPLEVSTSCNSGAHPNPQVIKNSSVRDCPSTDKNSVPTVDPVTNVVTRSGRVVKRPHRFQLS